MEIQDIVSQVKEDITNFKKDNHNGIIIIRGATATGKSKLSVMIGDFFDIEIISADSRQIFKYMNIGTDKVSDDILKKIHHHQINIVNPDERYTAGQRKDDTEKLIQKIFKKKKIPLIVGGTGLYIDTIYKNFSMPSCPPDHKLRKKLEDKEIKKPGILYKELMEIDTQEANKLHPNSIRYIIRALEIYHKTGKTKTQSYLQSDVKRPTLMIGLRREKEDTNHRINIRIKEMIKNGLIDEVRGLLKKGYGSQLQSMQGIGYKETIEYLNGNYDLEKLEETLKRNTHYLAKKQRTWFRRYIAEAKQIPKKNVTYKLYKL
ncbi:tRNA (adenosine(37)-N6)-dimethylallyltransferase MiaA [Candidatus Gracilibacteria bacterium]|nr:tRNA (adenosine(37)-N6)-dimethylallyltransferase MiaA [Candidatus Gracilibacteria bacterium]